MKFLSPTDGFHIKDNGNSILKIQSESTSNSHHAKLELIHMRPSGDAHSTTSLYLDTYTTYLSVDEGFALQTNGSTRMYAHGNGSIGINTAAPNAAAKLHVSGRDTSPSLNTAVPADITAIFSNSDVQYGTMFATDSSGKGYIQQRRVNNATYYDLLLQPYGGAVGIGTTSPADELEVYGNGKHTAIRIHEDAGTHEARLHLRRGGSDWELINTNDFTIENEGVERLRIKTGGDVGIGTPSPQSKLEVHGQTRVVGSMMVGNSSTSNVAAGILHIKNSGEASIRLEDSDSSNLAFDVVVNQGQGFYIEETVGGDSGDDTRFFIAETTGNVGISTTSPSDKLHVNGAIRATDLKINTGSRFFRFSGTTISILSSNEGSVTSGATNVAVGRLGLGSTYSQIDIGAHNKTNQGYISAIWATSGKDALRVYNPSNTQVVKVTENGHFGIGTTTVSHGITVSSSPSNGRIARLGNLEITTQHATYTGSSIVVTGANSYISYVSTLGHKFITRTQGGGNTLEALTIQPDTGNVGIGDTTPSYKLEVNGQIAATNNREQQSQRVLVDGDVLQPFNNFGNGDSRPKKFLASHLTDRFFGRGNELYVTKDGVVISNPNAFFDGSFDSQISIAEAGDPPVVININTDTNGLTNSNGFTYPQGVIKIAFYSGRHGVVTAIRTKDRNDVWRDLTVTEDYIIGSSGVGAYQAVVPSNNYITDFEITIQPQEAGGTATWLASVEYHGLRMGLSEGGLITTNGGKVYNTLQGRNAGSTTWSLGSTGTAYFGGNVGIGITNPYATLTVAGNITQTSNSHLISTRKITARDGSGLALYNDGGAGIDVLDNNNVNITHGSLGVGVSSPDVKFHVSGDAKFNNGYVLDSLIHSGDSDTYIKFDTNRVRIYAGNTVKFDSNYTYNRRIGTNSDIDTGGYNVIDQLTMIDGVITAHSTRRISNLHFADTRDVNDAPNHFDQELSLDFKNNSSIGNTLGNTYSGVMTLAPWRDPSGGWSHQLIFSSSGATESESYIGWRVADPNQADASQWSTIRKLATQDWVGSQGYLTSLPSHNHDDRYYTETESDSRFKLFSNELLSPRPEQAAPPDSYPLGLYLTDSESSSPYSWARDAGIVWGIHPSNSNNRHLQFLSNHDGTELMTRMKNGTADEWRDWNHIATRSWVGSQGYLTSVPSGYATETYVNTAVSNLVASAPAALDTLNELAEALGDDPNFSTTVTNSIATKLPLAGGTLTGDLTIGTEPSAGLPNPYGDFAQLIFDNSHNSSANGPNKIVMHDNGSHWKGGFGIHSATVAYYSGQHHKWYKTNADSYDQKMSLDDNGNLVVTGTLSASGYNKSDWDTAYGWGNHASAGYLTSVPSEYLTQTEGDARYLQSLPSHSHTFASITNKTAFVDNGMLSGRSTNATDTVGDSTGVSFNYLLDNQTSPEGVDHALMTMSYSNAWQTQLAQDWRENGRMYIRGQENGTWSAWGQVWSSHDFSPSSFASSSHTHAASAITSGTFAAARIPSLAASKITSGTFAAARIPNLSASKITSGTFADARIASASNWNTAYGWGNHASAGYLTGGSDISVRNITARNISPEADRTYALGTDSSRWQIVFCETLDSAGQHESNLQDEEQPISQYETGTVLSWKDGKNRPCTQYADHMRMGIAVHGQDSPLIQGAEPVLCTGIVEEGDYLVTSKKEGHAVAVPRNIVKEQMLFDCVIGKALENGDGESHLIKTWINI